MDVLPRICHSWVARPRKMYPAVPKLASIGLFMHQGAKLWNLCPSLLQLASPREESTREARSRKLSLLHSCPLKDRIVPGKPHWGPVPLFHDWPLNNYRLPEEGYWGSCVSLFHAWPLHG